MANGSTYRRCSCTHPETGKLLGTACPKRTQRGHGVWCYRIELPADHQGRRRPRRRSGFATAAAAQAELDHVRQLLALPDPADRYATTTVGDIIEKVLTDRQPLPSCDEVRRRVHSGIGAGELPTIADWLDTWLPAQRHLSASTLRCYEGHIRLYLKPALGPLRIDRLRVAHIADMIETIEEFNDRIAEYRASPDPALRALTRYRKPIGPTSLQRLRATLRVALNDAIREGLITTNPAALIKLPSGRKPTPLVWTDERVTDWHRTGRIPGPVMVWTPEQTGRFLDHATTDRLYALWHLYAYRGLRRGEACAVHWSDLNLAAATLTIRFQLLVDGWTPRLDDPKTASSKATIPLAAATVDVLTVHQMAQHAERDDAGDDWHDTGLAFTRPDGQPLHPTWVSHRFRELATEADLPPIRLHDLRHGAATLALAAGMDMKLIQHMLRHSTMSTTADTYTSVLPQLARHTADSITDIVPRRTQ